MELGTDPYLIECDPYDWLIQPTTSNDDHDEIIALPVQFSQAFADVYDNGFRLSDAYRQAITPGAMITLFSRAHHGVTGVVTPSKTLQVRTITDAITGSPGLSLPTLMGIAGSVIREQEGCTIRLWDWSSFIQLLGGEDEETFNVVCHFQQTTA